MEFSSAYESDEFGLDESGPDVAERADLAVEDDRLAEATGPRYLSPSSASLYRQCSRKWKFRYQDRLPDPPGLAALAGTFAHRVLEVLMGLAPEQRTLDSAKELARECWPEMEQDPDYQALDLDVDHARKFRWQAWKAIEGLWALEDPQRVTVEATELDLLVEVEGVPFRGIVDRIDADGDDLTIVDYKSGTAPAHRFVNERLDQVLMYAAAVHAETQRMPSRASLHYLGQRSIGVDVSKPRIDVTIKGLQTTWESLSANVLNDTFPAHVGPLCAWCPFIGACDEGQTEVLRRQEEGRVRSDAPALVVLAAAS